MKADDQEAGFRLRAGWYACFQRGRGDLSGSALPGRSGEFRVQANLWFVRYDHGMERPGSDGAACYRTRSGLVPS